MKYSNRKVQIGEVADSIRNGLSVKQYRDFNGLPITRIETISNGVIDPVRVGYAGISPGEKDEWLLKNGDILISHINSKEHLGKCAIYEESPKHLIHGMNLLNLRLNTQKAYPWFILHILKSPQFRSTFSKITKDSVNQSSFNISSFKELEIPLPPISAQKRIAAILDKADIIRQKRQESIRMINEFIHSTFFDMFGDPEINPKMWSTERLGKVASINPCLVKSNISGNMQVSFVPMSAVSEIFAEIVSPEIRMINDVSKGFTPFQEGDVLFAKITPCMENGKAAIAKGLTNGIGYGSTEFHVIRPSEHILASYLLAFVRRNSFRKKAAASFTGSAGQKRVPVSFLKELILPIPDISLQNKFDKIFQKAIEWRNKLISMRKIDQTLFDALVQRAFRGEL